MNPSQTSSHLDRMRAKRNQMRNASRSERKDVLTAYTRAQLQCELDGRLLKRKDNYKAVKTLHEYYLTGEAEKRAKAEACRMLQEQFAAQRARGWKV